MEEDDGSDLSSESETPVNERREPVSAATLHSEELARHMQQEFDAERELAQRASDSLSLECLRSTSNGYALPMCISTCV